ncbi:hypothetical protein NDU88_000700 [Pleurodeles waltl]|uniref:Uncharacterized protein n=1 Tax=Pleurodeles waltl TaxID=8319 RepID=A0AAV7L8W4_PLEWA|nr:hypothetical protein NDU88_000700 [Pleurodeles waltl]
MAIPSRERARGPLDAKRCSGRAGLSALSDGADYRLYHRANYCRAGPEWRALQREIDGSVLLAQLPAAKKRKDELT